MRGSSGQASNRATMLRFAGAGPGPLDLASCGVNFAGDGHACDPVQLAIAAMLLQRIAVGCRGT